MEDVVKNFLLLVPKRFLGSQVATRIGLSCILLF